MITEEQFREIELQMGEYLENKAKVVFLTDQEPTLARCEEAFRMHDKEGCGAFVVGDEMADDMDCDTDTWFTSHFTALGDLLIDMGRVLESQNVHVKK